MGWFQNVKKRLEMLRKEKKITNLLVKYHQFEKQFQLERMESTRHPMDRNQIELVRISLMKITRKIKCH